MSNNPNWGFTLPPLADVNPFNPGQGALPTGYYAVRIDSTEELPAVEGKDGGVVFSFTVTEAGEFQGRTGRTTLWKSKDQQTGHLKKANAGLWKNALMSVGAQNHHMTGNLQVGPNTFNGKGSFIYAEAPADGEQNKFTNYTIITRDMYEKGKQQMANKPANAAPAGGAGGANFGAAPANPTVAAGSGQPPAGGAPGFGSVPTPPANGGSGVAMLGQTQGAGAPPPPPATGGQQATSGVSF